MAAGAHTEGVSLASADKHHAVSSESLRNLGLAVLDKIGVPPEEAQVTIDSLVQADLWGVHSHGMKRLPWYAQRIARGGTNSKPTVRVVHEAPATAVIDGDGGLGQVVSQRAMNLAIEKAKQYGVGSVTVRNSHHFGTCAYWARMALPRGMIGLATTNGGPVMAPWGGLTPTMSNDPIGVAVPAGDELPIVLDMATTVAAGGKLDVLASMGEKIPLGWALDANGNQTDDPVAGRAGLLLPVGEHKGYGLTVVFEVLAAVLGGANFGRQVPRRPDPAQPMNIGHYFQAINVEAFMPVDEFKKKIDNLVHQMKSSRLAPGTVKISLPGEIEIQTAVRYSGEGIPMPGPAIDDLRRLARELGITDNELI